MGFLNNIMHRIGFVSAKSATRAFAAAASNRFTEDWKAFYTSIDSDIYMNLPALRARSRDLTQNDPYAFRFNQLCVLNIVGSKGFQLQVKSFDRVMQKGEWVIKYDEVANTMLEEAFADWSKREHCTVTGTQSFLDVQKLVVKHAGRDGEYLIRKIYDKNLKYGFCLQVLQPELLDEKLNKDFPSGNFIRMGIEFNSYRRPVAYWLKVVKPVSELSSGYNSSVKYERIDASEIYHGFIPEHSSQSRGIPWMTASMMRMRMLSGYEDAAVKNARAGANKMGFFTSKGGEQMLGPKDADGNIIHYGEPGAFEQLPQGVEFVPYDPKFPSEQHGAFVKPVLRGVAAGFMVSYNTFANDLEGVNYSSIRAGVLDEREQWKSLQMWMIEGFMDRVYADWLSMTLLKGVLNLPSSKYDKFNAPVWIGRRWAWVDPEKDMQAHIIARQAGFETSSEIVGEQGGDLEEKYATIAREKQLAAKHGLKLTIDQTQQPVQQSVPSSGASEQQKKTSKEQEHEA